MTSTEESFNCVFCKETFENKEELQDHFRKHGDPKFNESMKRASESEACGEKSAESDVVSCDVCSDTFPSISKAITHKHKVHPDHDAKYFCPWCGKLFTMKHLYNKHVETSHSSKMQYESNGFHCDYCEADFFVPSAMVYHNKFFHRQDTELAAIGQSRKLKLFNQDMLPLYYCPFCGEEYLNKVNLHKHMGDDHSDENQSPDDVLRCPLCEAIFYHLDAYELHLTFHSTEDTYSEENEIIKNITEFSLEAVPPIMEKVENEATADSEATMNSIGIGDFLQLGMDESVDNESGEKRKKKKKHKKSKKAAITLDEFLNMNKDVFGEGIDVEGIEEVPSQVVAKRLKRLPQKPKPPTKMMPSKELEKLKQQGIVIKKRPGNIPKFSSIKTMKGIPSGKPLNIPQNRIVKKDIMDKTNPTNELLLSKLLGQGNCQLKIVKKPLLQVSNPESKQPSSVEGDTSVKEKDSEQDKIDEHDLSKSSQHEEFSNNENESKESKPTGDHTPYKVNLISDSQVKQEANNETTEINQDVVKNGVKTHENIIEHVEVNKQPQDKTLCTNKTGEKETLNDSAEVTESSETVTGNKDDSQINLNSSKGHENKIDTNKKSIDTLKNLSHLTIKPLNQPKLSTLHLTKRDDEGCESEDTDETVKFKTDNCSLNKQEYVQKPKEDGKLEALKLFNKNITVKTSKQPVQPNIQQNIMETEKLKTGDSTNKQEQPIKIKENKNLEALKLLSKNITIKSPNQSTQPNIRNDVNQNEDDENGSEELLFEDNQQPLQKPKEVKNLEALKLLSKNITIKSPNQSTQPNKRNDVNQNEDDEDGSEELLSEDNQQPLQKPKEDKNLEALKLLSKNITIKSSNQPTQPNIRSDINQDKDDEDGSDELLSEDNQEPLQKPKEDKNLEALKLLSKNITIKSPNQPVQANKYLSSDSDQEIREGQDFKTTNNKQVMTSLETKSQASMKSTTKCSPVAKNPVLKNPPVNNHPRNKSSLAKEIANCNNSRNNHFKESTAEKQLVKTQHCDILKQLPHITTKQGPKIRQQVTSSVFKSCEVVSSKEGTIVKSSMKMEEHKGIETFNVDDSDDEELLNTSSALINTKNKPLKISPQAYNPPHTEKLKSISQQIETKTTRQNPAKRSFSHLDSFEDSDFDDTDANSVEIRNRISNENKQHDAEHAKNSALQNKLKNLSKHITVKSRNSSPNITPLRIKINQNVEQDDSDTEIGPAKVKISELSDDLNDDEELDELKDTEPSNCIVESPKQLSENEEYDNDEDNIESHIKPNTSQKPIRVTQSHSRNSLLNNLQNISKDITIKSSGTRGNFDSEDEYDSPHEMNSNIKSNINKNISLKHQANIPSKNMARSNNQVVRASDIDHNTANTEVIVKKFGSQTVIEEITTTVTKTIRTVNQTVRQEVTSSSNINSPRPQRIQNMNPRQQVWQGQQIRQAAPTIGTKVRNIAPQVRSPQIRPTNQIVSVRPGLNIRPNPRMTVAKTPTCTTTSNSKQPVLGKPLRISPYALSPSNKRPPSEDSNGPFSCFKKQKESLIPMGDLPEISQGDASVLYASSHVSKSHVSNTTKIMTGDSVVSSSQVRSEMKASSEQFNRLSNMSGLKVVKTTSTKQASKVEECEMSSSNRSTLDAIERLKKQGLLIKKPRLDENFSEHSNSDDNF